MLQINNPYNTPVDTLPTVGKLKPGELFEVCGHINMVLDVNEAWIPESTLTRMKERGGDDPGYRYAVELATGEFGVFHGLTLCQPVDGKLDIVPKRAAGPVSDESENG